MSSPPPQPSLLSTTALTHPCRTLTAAFVVWKFVLLLIAIGAVLAGEAYDTSANIVILGTNATTPATQQPSLFSRLVARLTSWDAIYFTSIARDGYVHEQFWAFGSGLPGVVRGVLKASQSLGLITPSSPNHSLLPESLIAITTANTAHLLSAFILHRLGALLFPRQQQHPSPIPLIAALLHILSPAGLFLSAPYSESSFALLSFVGYLLFALAHHHQHDGARRDAYTLAAGVVFGAATVFRSNGVLNGLLFAWEGARILPGLGRRNVSVRERVGVVRRLVVLGIAGVCVALGTVVPQAVAYRRFCLSGSGDGEGKEVREWCGRWVPSIYAFVQAYYWNTGFLRYWTVSNLPLFLLAAPMLTILVVSGVAQLKGGGVVTTPSSSAETSAPPEKKNPTTPTTSTPSSATSSQQERFTSLLTSAAAAQVLLAILALTSYHVQIITRLSSGYPLWYWWVAGKLVSSEERDRVLANRIVMFMVMYAAVQGVLFASFLPPA
ncbi:hypothetical protein VTJ04DRAFT_6620 [Mycothermus thermophilus]|uniref:uncharacterized protein n=1 Tax=Humicola insolens TaxID=85995 RepID=UPI0037429288